MEITGSAEEGWLLVSRLPVNEIYFTHSQLYCYRRDSSDWNTGL